MLTGVNHITISVSELNKSLAFYVELLGLTLVVKWNQGAYLTLGELWFCLSCDNSQPNDDYSHIAFSIKADDFERFVALIKEHNISTWKENSSEGLSCYILDPDGHKFEVHCGDLESRLQELKKAPYDGLEWCQ